MSGPRRVVVSGMGVISPIGNDTTSYWRNLLCGHSGIGAPTLVTDGRLRPCVVAEVKGFVPSLHFTDRELSTADRVSQFALVAAKQAIQQAEIDFTEGLSTRTGTIIGIGVGGQTTHDDSFRRLYLDRAERLHPLTIPRLMVNGPASQVSMHYGLRGPTFVVASACASATHAIGVAFQMVRSGTIACAVTGGSEACITFGTLKAWEAMRIMAPDTCRPFSIGRRGMVLGEGAAILVIESLDHARKRGARILGEIVGCGMSADAADIIAPDHEGMVCAMESALSDGGIAPGEVQYVNAHGTGTVANDAAETQALKRVFGPRARDLAVSSTKSMVGHALGAAGALELVATLMAMRDGIVPPTVGYLGPDPECDLDYVPNVAREMSINTAVSNSFAFGGLNAVLAVRRVQ